MRNQDEISFRTWLAPRTFPGLPRHPTFSVPVLSFKTKAHATKHAAPILTHSIDLNGLPTNLYLTHIPSAFQQPPPKSHKTPFVLDLPRHHKTPFASQTHVPTTPFGEIGVEPSDLEKLPTPINILKFSKDLTGYDPILKTKLIIGFQQGFDLGFRGYPNNDLKVSNLKSVSDHPLVIDSAISKELAAKRIAGPFCKPPFNSFQINPIGIVPKKIPGSFRMITNLSSPAGTSINDNIDDIFSNVSYTSIEEAIKLIISAGPHAYLAKSDIQHAFRLIPITPAQYHLLCFKWKDSFYYDRCLPMGARSSCQLFELFSSAIQFILNKNNIKFVTHYLDDFMMANSSYNKCLADLNLFLDICASLNIPIASDKTFLPSQKMIFLGLEIDTLQQTIKIPKEKIQKANSEIQTLIRQKKCTLVQLQSLLGLLQFTCRVIVPGRAFLQSMYRLTVGCSKPFHRIRVTANVKKDLLIWLQFLQHFNGVSLYKEEMFLSPSITKIYTDASQSLGVGGVWGNKWFSLPWPSEWWTLQNITFLELVPIVLAIEAWGPFLKNQCILLNTDNMALTYIINKQSSKEDLVRIFIRRLVLAALKYNILLKATHIPGHSNTLSDSLSRLQITRFFILHPMADKNQYPVTSLPLSIV